MRKLGFRYFRSFTELNNFLPTLFDILNNAVRFKVGNYTGTGVAQSILTDISPVFIIITDEAGTIPVFWFDGLVAGNSIEFDGTVLTTGILSLTDDRNGFKIGTHANVNTNLTTYKYIVFGEWEF